MECPNHPGRAGVRLCVECARQFCAECITERDGRPYCPECAAKLEQPSPPAQFAGPESPLPPPPPSYPPPPPPPAAYGAASPSGLAIASMICGILSIVCCCGTYLSLALALVAIGLGAAALSPAQPRDVRQASYGYAVVGVITGGAGMVLFIAALLISVMFADVWRAWLQRMPGPPTWRP